MNSRFWRWTVRLAVGLGFQSPTSNAIEPGAAPLDLPVASAEWRRVEGKRSERTDGNPPGLKVENGVITGWEADAGRPAWTLDVPAAGLYRVTAYRSLPANREAAWALHFTRDGKEARLTAPVPAGPADGGIGPAVLGTVRLQPGRHELVCKPQRWTHPFEMGSLAGFRLEPAEVPASTAPFPLHPVPAPPPPAASTTLFPAGNPDALPPQFKLPADAPVTRVDLPPLDHAHPGFANRREPDALRALAERLDAAIEPGHPHAATFRAALAEGRWMDALTAYRDHFLARLRDPEAFGALTQNIAKEHLLPRGREFLLRRPDPRALEANRSGRFFGLVRGEAVSLGVGEPGRMRWTPVRLPPADATYGRGPDTHPFWKSAEGKALSVEIDATRMLRFLPADSDSYLEGGLFPALLHAYAATGNAADLRRWCDVLDDFCLSAPAQHEAYPVTIRAATELEPQQLRVLLMTWRVILDERPEFARDLDPATLARFLLHATADIPPWTIRAKRAQLANWGIMGICDLAHLSRFLGDFRAMHRLDSECWRLWQANFPQHRTPDGENAEAWDTGHNGIDIEYALHALPVLAPLARDPGDYPDFLDQVRVNQRSLLTHLTPDGQYWPSWLPEGRDLENDVRARWLRNGWLDLVRHEPEALHRIEATLTGRPGPGGPPERTSDYAPYSAMAYLREGWSRTDAMWIFQNFQTRSQGLRECSNTSALLARGGRYLLNLPALAVNGRPDNRFHGATPAGGKTGFGGEADTAPVNGRFFSSAHLDFVEGVQDYPYAAPAENDRFDVFGLHAGTPGGRPDAAPVTDTRVIRQVFLLKHAGVSIVSDRIVAPPGVMREYTQFLGLPRGSTLTALRKVAANPAIQPEWVRAESALADEESASISTHWPQGGNLSVSVSGPGPVLLANRLNRRGLHEISAVSAADALLTALRDPRRDDRFFEDNFTQIPVSARWIAHGPFATVLAARLDEPDPPGGLPVREIRTKRLPGGVVEADDLDLQGHRFGFQRAATGTTRVRALEFSAEAETLFAWRTPSNTVGIVLGARVFARGNQNIPLPFPDAAFTLARDGALSFAAVHRPLAEVTIEPAVPVFTDTVEVRLTSPDPDARLHYTLDGTEPTLDSPRYTRPIRLDRSTRVRVRPLREGLTRTPWHTGIDAGKTQSALFVRRPWQAAVQETPGRPGLRAEVVDGRWTELFTHAGHPGLLPVRTHAVVTSLFNEAELRGLRAPNGTLGLRADGFLVVPRDGVYTFVPPDDLFRPVRDAGYDLRLWINGEEWFPVPRVHATHTWSVPLRAGPHRIRVALADYREQPHRNEWWMPWPAEFMGKDTPLLRVLDGRGEPQPVPADWLRH